MALDTRDERFAMMGMFQPVPSVLPNPDGGFTTEADRFQLMFLYNSIEAGVNIQNTRRPLVGVGI